MSIDGNIVTKNNNKSTKTTLIDIFNEENKIDDSVTKNTPFINEKVIGESTKECRLGFETKSSDLNLNLKQIFLLIMYNQHKKRNKK